MSSLTVEAFAKECRHEVNNSDLRFSLLISAAPNAKAATLSCDGCSAQEIHALAQNHLLSASIKHPAYVTNFVDGTIRKYVYRDNMTEDFDPETDIFHAWAEAVEVETTIRDLIADLYSVRGPMEYDLGHADPQSGLQGAAQQADWRESAWNIVDAPILDEQVANYIATRKEDFFQRVAYWATTFNPITGFTPGNIKLSIRVNFNDGSRAVYLFDGDTKTWKRVEGETRDSHNNSIPEKREDFSGGGITNYQFENESSDLANFLYRANQMHIPIVPPSGGGGGGSTVAVSCVTTPGGDVICYIQIL